MFCIFSSSLSSIHSEWDSDLRKNLFNSVCMRKSTAFSRRSLSSLTAFFTSYDFLWREKKKFQNLYIFRRFWMFIWAFLTNSPGTNITQIGSINNNWLNSLAFVDSMSETNETGFDLFLYSLFTIFFPYSKIYFIKIMVFWYETFSSRVICGFDCFSVCGFQFFHEKFINFDGCVLPGFDLMCSVRAFFRLIWQSGNENAQNLFK